MDPVKLYQQKLLSLAKASWKAGCFDVKKLSTFCRSKENPPVTADFAEVEKMVEKLSK